jgi:hypothetical protein
MIVTEDPTMRHSCIVMGVALASAAYITASIAAGGSAGEPAIALKQMEGVWTVSQRMWPGAGAEPVNLSAGLARRRLVHNSFVEEVMESLESDGADSFRRVAYLNYNVLGRRYEYFSLDSRLPQMMNERSLPGDALGGLDPLKLDGSRFVAPTWGKENNVPFKYRLEVGAVHNDNQVIHLFLTPTSGKNRKEFLAFEYVYTRSQQ